MNHHRCNVECRAGERADVRRHPHRRRLEPDADQLHAVVRFDQHVREVRLRRNAEHPNLGHAECFKHALSDLRGRFRPLAARHAPRNVTLRRLQAGETLAVRIDRAADQRGRGTAGCERPQCHDQVFEDHDRFARRHADGPAESVVDPGFRRTGDHKVVLIRIAKDVLHALQPGEVLHRFVRIAARIARLANGPLEPDERDLTHVRSRGEIGGCLGPGVGEPHRVQAAGRIGMRGDAEHALGVDGDAEIRKLNGYVLRRRRFCCGKVQQRRPHGKV